MSFGSRSFVCIASTGLFLLIHTPRGNAQTQPPAQRQGAAGRKLEVSKPRNSDTVTNLHQLNDQEDGLKRLEDQLMKPLSSFSSESSLGGSPAPINRPQAGPVIRNKRAQEKLDREKNWAYLNPSDLSAPPSLEELLGVPEFDKNGQPKKKGTAIEKYYDDQARKYSGTNLVQARFGEENFFGSRSPDDPRAGGAQPDEDSSLPEGLRESERGLRKLFDGSLTGSPFASEPSHSTFSDIFGLGTASPPDALQGGGHPKDWQQMFESPVAPSFNSLGGMSPGTAGHSSAFDALGGSSHPFVIDTHPTAGLPTLPGAMEAVVHPPVVRSDPPKYIPPPSPTDIKRRPL
jgi:hypothetical protein